MERLTPTVLAVGTTHPLNIAGLGIPLRVAQRLGVRVVSIVVGVTAQSAQAVLARTPLDAATISAQFAALAGVPIAAIHVGACLDATSVIAVARELEAFSVPIICDPVVATTNGGQLADDATIVALHERLFALCALITPNVPEIERLTGTTVIGTASMEMAARQLCGAGPAAVLVKGGHLVGDPVDVLVSATGHATWFRGERLDQDLRGTGDLLATGVAARVAHGDTLLDAIGAARSLVRACILAGEGFAGTRALAADTW